MNKDEKNNEIDRVASLIRSLKKEKEKILVLIQKKSCNIFYLKQGMKSVVLIMVSVL